MSIGIYKITNPKGKVYIGQSVNIERRWKYYKKIKCNDQPILFNSLMKYGWDPHDKKIIEECLIEQLNERESYYKQKFIEEFGKDNSLFCNIFDNGGGPLSAETKEKISKSKKGITYSKESSIKKSQSLKGRTYSEETICKMRENNKGKSRGKGIKKSQSHINKMSEKRKNPILQYDIKGNLLRKWNGMIDVKKELNIDINSCIRGISKTSGGFLWRKEDNPFPPDFNFDVYLTKKDKNKPKPMTDEHKKNIGKSLKGRKCVWLLKDKKELCNKGLF
jgi:group I intron endonuclease